VGRVEFRDIVDEVGDRGLRGKLVMGGGRVGPPDYGSIDEKNL
jgi:hypothetical protein